MSDPVTTTSALAASGSGSGSARASDPAASAVDAAVLTRVGAGDARALGDLYDRFGRRVYSLARRICGEAGAADVVQEVFLAVWRSAGRFDPARGSAVAWLMTLTHHEAVDAVRREAVLRRHTRPAGEDDWALPHGPGADEPAVGSIVALEVRAALAALPPAQRTTVALSYYGGYTQREVAAILGVPLGTVKSRTFQAMAVLRVHLRPLHQDAGSETSATG